MFNMFKRLFQKKHPAHEKRVLQNVDDLERRNNDKTIDKNYFYDALTEIVFSRFLPEDATCVDVGCHQGAILDKMMEYAEKGKFYAFEPLPHLFEDLKKRYQDHENVTVYNTALSDTVGKSSFNYVITNPGYSGLIKRRYDRPEEQDTQITVETNLLDNLVKDDSVDLIKVDVEGAEEKVLLGAKGIIARDKPLIIFEHGLGGADCYGTTPEAIFDLLVTECGLTIMLLNDYLKNRPPLTKSGFCDQFYNGLNYYFLACPAP